MSVKCEQSKFVFDDFEYLFSEKRNHFKAEWEKFYSVWAFDFTKYNLLRKMIANNDFDRLDDLALNITAEQLKKYDIETLRQLCYVLDENGQRQHLGDKKHIYRTKTLIKLRSMLVPYIEYGTLMSFAQIGENEIVKDFGDFIYYEERYTTEKYLYQGGRFKGQKFTTKDIELKWVVDTDTKTQIKAYIKVLRLCRRGKSLEEAVKIVKEG